MRCAIRRGGTATSRGRNRRAANPRVSRQEQSMIIDCHAHFTAPDSLWVYKANLLANRGGQGRSRWHCTDEAIHAAMKKPVHGGKSHLEQLAEVGTDLQILSPRPYQLMHSEKP